MQPRGAPGAAEPGRRPHAERPAQGRDCSRSGRPSGARLPDRHRVARPAAARWRSITSTATGGTTVRRTCGFCAPTAMRPRTLTGAATAEVSIRAARTPDTAAQLSRQHALHRRRHAADRQPRGVARTIDDSHRVLRRAAPYQSAAAGDLLQAASQHFGIDVSHSGSAVTTARTLISAAPGAAGRPSGKPSAPTAASHSLLPCGISATARHTASADSRAVPRSGVSRLRPRHESLPGAGTQRGKPVTTPVKRSRADTREAPAGTRRTRTVLLRRALTSRSACRERCAECGTGRRLAGQAHDLEIDHINGDWRDNRPENLRYLCPNCHALTDTWCRGRPHAGASTAPARLRPTEQVSWPWRAAVAELADAPALGPVG